MSVIYKLVLLQLACASIVLANSNRTTSTTISVVTRTITLPQGYIHYPSIQAAYKVHTENLNWNDAKQACIAEGGRLAVINTVEKLGFVKATKPRQSSIWVGVTKKRGHWVTAHTASELSHLPWGTDQPEGVGDCVAVEKKGKGLYNRLCMWNQKFVCEIPIETTVYQIPCKRN